MFITNNCQSNVNQIQAADKKNKLPMNWMDHVRGKYQVVFGI